MHLSASLFYCFQTNICLCCARCYTQFLGVLSSLNMFWWGRGSIYTDYREEIYGTDPKFREKMYDKHDNKERKLLKIEFRGPKGDFLYSPQTYSDPKQEKLYFPSRRKERIFLCPTRAQPMRNCHTQPMRRNHHFELLNQSLLASSFLPQKHTLLCSMNLPMVHYTLLVSNWNSLLFPNKHISLVKYLAFLFIRWT